MSKAIHFLRNHKIPQKDDLCDNFIVTIKFRWRGCCKATKSNIDLVDDSIPESLGFAQQIDQKWSNRCGNTTFALEKQCRIREVLLKSGFLSGKPDACRDRRLQFGESQTVLVVEARNRKNKIRLAGFCTLSLERQHVLWLATDICTIGVVGSTPICSTFNILFGI